MSKKHEEKLDIMDAILAVTLFGISLFIFVMIVWFLLSLVF